MKRHLPTFASPCPRMVSLALALILLAGAGQAANVTWNVGGGGAWDTGSPNWSGRVDNLYYESDNATFNNTTGGIIAIQGGGVSPTATTVSATSGTYTFTGGPLASGSLTKTNGGRLVLEAGNSYAGTTTIAGGVLDLRHDDSLGSTAGTTTINNGAALELQGGIVVAETITFNGNGISSGGSIRNVAGDNRLTGSVILGGTNSSIRTDAGTLTIANGINRSSGRELVLGGEGNITVEGAIDGGNSFSKVGSGTLTFMAANTFTSAFGVNTGTVNVRHAQALGGTSNGTTVASGATLELQGGVTVAGEVLSLNGTGLAGNGALRNVSGDNTWITGISYGNNALNRVQSDSGTLALGGLSTSTNHASLTFGGEGDITLYGSIAPQHWRLAVTKDGNGTLALTGANYFTSLPNAASKDGSATLTINAGTLSAQAGNSLADAGATAGSGTRTLVVTDSSTLAVGQTVVGAGLATSSIIAAIDSPTQVTLSTDTTGAVSGVTFGTWTSLGGAPLVLNGGSLALNGKSHQVGTVAIGNAAGGSPTVTVGTLAATGNYTAYAGSVAANLGEMGGNRTFTKAGAGTLTLSGANTYTGTTAVNDGTLALDFTPTTAPADNIINNANNSSALNLGLSYSGGNGQWSSYSGGSLQVQGKDLTANSQRFNGLTLAQNSFANIAVIAGSGGSATLTLGTMTRNGGSTVNFDQSGSVSIATTTGTANALLVGGQGQAYATVNGDTWALKDGSNANLVGATSGFYTASTATALANHADLTGGDTTLAANTALSTVRFGDNAPRTLDLNGNTLVVNTGAILVADTVGTPGSRLAGGALTSGATNSGGRDLIIHQHSGESFEIASAIVNNSADSIKLYKSGPGVLLLTGTNTFTGSTTVSSGTLEVGSAAALGATGNSLFISRGATLNLNGTDAGVGTLQGSGVIDNLSSTHATLTIGNGNAHSYDFPGMIQNSDTGTVAITKTGTGQWNCWGANTYSGGTTLINGSATLGVSSTTGSGGAVVSGPLGIGTVTLAGGTIGTFNNVTLHNPIFAAPGTVSTLNNSQGLTLPGNITGTGTITVASNNAKDLNLSGDNSGFEGVFINNTGTQNNTLRFKAAASGSAAAQWSFVKGSAQLEFADGTIAFGKLDGSVTLNKNAGGGTTTVEVGALGLDGTYSGAIGNSNGTLALRKVGSATQYLTGTSTYTGGTTIQAGALNVSADAPLGATSGSLTFAGGTLQAGAATTTLAAARNIVINDSVTGYFDSNGNTLDIEGGIGGNGNLAKIGAGVMAIGGTGTYAGSTEVSEGTLLVNGTLAAGGGNVMVAANATLGGTGSIARPVILAGGGIVSPGLSAGELTVNNTLTFTAGSAYKWELSTSGNDHLQVNGDLAVTGTPTLRLVNLGGADPTDQVYDLISFTGNLTASAPWAIDYGLTASASTVSNWIDGNSSWDIAANWDQAGWSGGTVTYTATTVQLSGIVDGPIAPGTATDVVIAPPNDAAVAGPAGPRSINSLTLGDSGAYDHSLTLQAGGPLTVATNVVVNPSGTLEVAAGGLTANQVAIVGSANLAGPFDLGTLNSSGTTTFAAGAGGTVGVLNVNDGTTTLAGGTTQVAAATVAGGTLQAEAGSIGLLTVNNGRTAHFGGTATVGELAGEGTIELHNNATFAVGGDHSSSTFEGTIAGAGSLAKTGDGTLTLGGDNSYTGDTLIDAGTLKLSSGTGSPPVAGATVWFDASDANSIQTAAGKVTQWTSNGTLSLTAAQIDANKQPTVLAAGSPSGLDLVDFGAFFSTNANGQSLSFNANVTDVRTAFVVFSGGGFLLGSTSAYDFHRNGALIDGSPLWDSTYAHANIRNGQTYINGTQVNGTTTGPAAGQLSVIDVVTTGNVQTNALALDRIHRSGGQKLGEVLIYNTALSDADRQAVEAYLTTKWITGGGSNGSLSIPIASAVTIALGATLDVNNATATIGSLAGAGSVLLGGGNLAVGQNDTSTVFSGSISGNAASTLGKIGAGTLTLTGSVQAGTLALAAGNTLLGAGANAIIGTLAVTGGTTTISAGATANIATASVVAGATLEADTGNFGTLVATAGTVNLGAGVTLGTATFTGGVGGAAVDTHGNYVTVTDSLTALPSPDNGIVATATSGHFGVQGSDLGNRIDGLLLDQAGSVVTLSQQVSGIAAGLDVRAWKAVPSGSGLRNLEGTAYDLNAPTVAPNDSTATFGGSLNYMTNNIHWNLAANQEWAINGGLSAAPYPTGYMTDYAVEYRGSIYIPSDGLYRFATSSDDRSALWLDPTSDNPSYNDAIVQNRFDQAVNRRQSSQLSLNEGYHEIIVRFTQGGGGHGLYVEWDPAGGSSFVDIPGLNYFHGGIVDGAINQPDTAVTAIATGGLAFPAGDSHLGNLTLGGTGTVLTLGGATSVTFHGNVAATGTPSVSLNGPALILAGAVDALGANDILTLPSVTLSAPTVTLNGSGLGTIILTGTTSFSPGANLILGGGQVLINGTLGNVATQVNNGAWLGGTGPITGPVTVAAGGGLAPGNSPGTLTVDNTVVLLAGAQLAFDLDTPDVAAGTGGNDWLLVTDELTLNPDLTLTIVPGPLFGLGTYHLIEFGSLVDNSNFFRNWLVAGLPEYTFAFRLDGTSLDLLVSANLIPEPASVLLLATAAALTARRRRR